MLFRLETHQGRKCISSETYFTIWEHFSTSLTYVRELFRQGHLNHISMCFTQTMFSLLKTVLVLSITYTKFYD
jgi:hypothetical protein